MLLFVQEKVHMDLSDVDLLFDWVNSLSNEQCYIDFLSCVMPLFCIHPISLFYQNEASFCCFPMHHPL